MEQHGKELVRFVFPPPATTPEYTPDTLTSSSSSTNLSDLTTTPVDNYESQSHLAELLEETLKFKDGLASIPHFRRILRQAQTLLHAHGPYTTYAGTSVFSRAPIARDDTRALSVEEIANSLAAAQDCIGSAQPEGPAQIDLALFEHLWRMTVSIIETITRTGEIDHVNLGWGIYGMCAGHVGYASKREEEAFLSLKDRLHFALRLLPSMDAPIRREDDQARLSGNSVMPIATLNREIHITANLHLQQFRRENYARIRWYHGIAVASRWIQHLRLE